MPPLSDVSRLTQWLVSRSLLSRAVAGSVLLALLVAGTFALMLVAVSNLRSSTNVQARSRDVTSSTLRLEQVVNQLEASLRGFVISGDARFLGSWRAGREPCPDATQQVTDALAGQRDQERARRAAHETRSRLRERVRAAADQDLPL